MAAGDGMTVAAAAPVRAAGGPPDIAGRVAWFATTAVLGAAALVAVPGFFVVADVGADAAQALPVLVLAGIVAGAVLGAVGWTSQRHPVAAVLLALLALVVTRVGLALLVDAPVVSDWAHYQRLALGWMQGAPPIADVPMGYPILLGSAFRLGGVSVATGELLNALLSIGTGAFLAAWLWTVAGSRSAALGVAVFALTPSDAFFATLLASEPAFSFAVAGVVLAMTLTLRAAARGHARRALLLALLTGAGLGAAAYVRATSLGLVPVLAVLPFVVVRPVRRAAPIALALVLAAGVTLLPVVAWNRATIGRWSASTSLYVGWQLYLGLNVESRGAYNEPDVARVDAGIPGYRSRAIGYEYAAGVFDARTLQLAARRDAVALDLALARLRTSATSLPLLLPLKYARVWSRGDYPVRWALDLEPDKRDATLSSAAHFGAQVWWLGLLSVGTAWFVGQRRRRPVEGLVIAAVVLPLALALLVLEAQARYHEPVVPLLAGLAGMMLASRWPGTGAAEHGAKLFVDSAEPFLATGSNSR